MAKRFDDSGPPDDGYEDPTIGILEEISEVVLEADKKLVLAGQADFDKCNTQNDWIAFVNAYIGRAADKVFRNDRENCGFRENMLKAAGLIVSAIRAHDAGYCEKWVPPKKPSL